MNNGSVMILAGVNRVLWEATYVRLTSKVNNVEFVLFTADVTGFEIRTAALVTLSIPSKLIALIALSKKFSVTRTQVCRS